MVIMIIKIRLIFGFYVLGNPEKKKIVVRTSGIFVR
jgi:hypothetical protein